MLFLFVLRVAAEVPQIFRPGGKTMSMSAHASTTAALKSLRAFSYDVASVSTEVMMGPLFDALKTSGIQESSIDVLDTVIVPNLRCMLRQEREGEIRARGDIFDVLFAVWSSHLVGKDGKPLLEPVDPFYFQPSLCLLSCLAASQFWLAALSL